jgi:multidrug efflux pump subunit AcrB
MWVAVEGEASIDEKFDLIDQTVQPALLRLPGVGGVLVFGGDERRHVSLIPRLAATE